MKNEKVRSLVFCALFAAVIAVLAQVQIPLPGLVPISLATFGVMLSGLLLGWRCGTLAVAVYVLLGAVGIPVFAGFKGGLSALMGPTGGYIVGYLPYALLAGLEILNLREKLWGRGMLLVIGTAVCYVLGTAWFVHVTGRTLAESMALCVVPFLPGDAVKIILAAVLTPRLKKALKA